MRVPKDQPRFERLRTHPDDHFQLGVIRFYPDDPDPTLPSDHKQAFRLRFKAIMDSGFPLLLSVDGMSPRSSLFLDPVKSAVTSSTV